MKFAKIIATMAGLLVAGSAMATDYTGLLTVTVNGASTQQETTITLNEENGLYFFSLNNFILKDAESALPVGNIALDSLTATEAYGYKCVSVDRKVVIEPGNDSTYSTSDWLGPLLGEVPLQLSTQFNDKAMSVSIVINMQETLGQNINVAFIGTPETTDEPSTGLKGDVNGDGLVNAGDISEIVSIMTE